MEPDPLTWTIEEVTIITMTSSTGPFNYCTGAVHVLSAILQNATGMRTREFANQNLFSPIGIESITETLAGYGLILTLGRSPSVR